MLAFMHVRVCFCALPQTFPLFLCLSVALSALNTTSVLSIVSLPDSPYHQKWPFPPTSLFLAPSFFREVKSSLLQSFPAARWGGGRLWHCSPRSIACFSLSILIVLLFSDGPFSSTKRVSPTKGGFYVTGDIFRADVQRYGGQTSQLSHSDQAFAGILL